MEYLKEDERQWRACCHPDYTELVARALELLSRLAEARKRVEELERRVLKYENDEASVCPEDVGFVEYIHVLLRRIEELERENRWIPVSEKLPEPTKHPLTLYRVWDSYWMAQYDAYYIGDCGDGPSWKVPNKDMVYRITHWRPLPSPPSVSPDCKVHGMDKEGKNEG